MNFLLYGFYFFRSAALRGLLATIRLLRAEVVFEKKFGIKTSAIKKSGSADFYHYQGASYLMLLRLFNDMPAFTKQFEFVDIGCGKGRAVFVAEYCGYSRLTGIELDAQLLEEARHNQSRYVFKRADSNINFVLANALDYNYRNKPTVYFLFNPFSEAVLRKVLNSIMTASSSETWIIYMNPQYKEVFVEKQLKPVNTFITGRYTEAVAYHINPASARS